MNETSRLSRSRRAPAFLTSLFVAVAVLATRSDAFFGANDQLVVFGDGYSDTGNAFHQSLATTESAGSPSSPPYFDGRFSNGPLWIETLAAELRSRAPEPSLLGGTNYAFAGAAAGTGDDTPNVGDQVDAFLASGNQPLARHLFVIWAGAADFDRCDFASSVEIPDPSALVRNLSAQIKKLAAAAGPDARLRFLVANLPPLGRTARARWLGETVDREIPALFDRLSIRFNALLAAEIQFLRISLDVDVMELDVFALSEEILSSPEDFGFTNVTTAAREGANYRGGPADATTYGTSVAPNVDEFVFFDDVYPTSAWHALVGRRARELVVEGSLTR